MIRSLALSLVAFSFSLIASAQSSPETAMSAQNNLLSLDRLFASPSLSGPSPRGVKFSPDGKRVTFLKARESDNSRYDLWQFDVETGAQSMLVDSTLLEPEDVALSEEEKALRERKRIAGQRGIVSYDWGMSDTLLVPIGGDLWLVTLTEDAPNVRQLTNTDAFEYDARVSPGGGFVSFIRDGAVHAIELVSGQETRLTPLAEPDNAISYGVAEFVAQEEMSRYTGYWWSSDDRYIAYTRVDETPVDIVERFDIQAEETTVINQRYPRAGRPNAIVDLFVYDRETGKATEIDWRREDWGPASDQYLARVNWVHSQFYIQRVNRDQTIVETATFTPSAYRSVDGDEVPATAPMPYWSETQDNWINLKSNWQFFASSKGRIDGVLANLSDQSGFSHIVMDEAIGTSRPPTFRNATEGNWDVTSIDGFDVDRQTLFFSGHKDTVLEHHLYSVALAENAEPTRLTELGKSWTITLSPDGETFVGTSSGPDHPPQTGLYRVTQNGSELITWMEENRLDETHPYFPYKESHTTPEFGTLTAEDGQTLHYSIQKPPNFDATKKYPVIIEVYGGPHAQTVTRNWERVTDQFYTHQGYIVFRLDNRGSYNRGKAFEDVIYRQTGGPEVRDQLLGVDWLKQQSFVDPDRIAMQGWSYGGYMTLMVLLQAPTDTFAAAVSGAPVTDWTLYDTFYTERYMDTPQDNQQGYEKSSVFYHLDRWEGDLPPLMLIHGMADDNVTFDNSTRLMAEMQEKGLHFELMTYPGQRHGIRGERLQKHLMLTRMRFLDRHLKDE